MKRAQLVSLIFVLLLIACRAMSQSVDWESVKVLPGGTKIKVQLKRGHTFGHCFFDGATDDQLACTVRGGFLSRRAVYPKDNVKAVFRAHNGTLIGIGVGAGAGAVMEASRATCCRGANAFFGALAGGAFGAIIGTAADPFFHGKAVYRTTTSSGPPSPNVPVTKSDASNAKGEPADQTETKISCMRDGATHQCVE